MEVSGVDGAVEEAEVGEVVLGAEVVAVVP